MLNLSSAVSRCYLVCPSTSGRLDGDCGVCCPLSADRPGSMRSPHASARSPGQPFAEFLPLAALLLPPLLIHTVEDVEDFRSWEALHLMRCYLVPVMIFPPSYQGGSGCRPPPERLSDRPP